MSQEVYYPNGPEEENEDLVQMERCIDWTLEDLEDLESSFERELQSMRSSLSELKERFEKLKKTAVIDHLYKLGDSTPEKTMAIFERKVIERAWTAARKVEGQPRNYYSESLDEYLSEQDLWDESGEDYSKYPKDEMLQDHDDLLENGQGEY